MNHSIHSADRSTHLKIVVVALVAGIAVAAFGISARTNSEFTQTAQYPGHEGGQAGGRHQLADLDGPLRASFSAPDFSTGKTAACGRLFCCRHVISQVPSKVPPNASRLKQPCVIPEHGAKTLLPRAAPRRGTDRARTGPPPWKTPAEHRRSAPAVNRVARVSAGPTRRLAYTARSLPFQFILRCIRPDAAQAEFAELECPSPITRCQRPV